MPEKPNDQPVALVTGAGRGIGQGIATALGAAGWAVVVNYVSNSSTAAETVNTIQRDGGIATAIQGNVAEAADRARIVEQTMAEYRRIDLLVNNAGMAPRQRGDLLQMSEASYDEVMAVNLK